MATTGPAPAHWDDVPGAHRATGHIAGRWAALGTAAGTRGVGLNRVAIDPDRWSTPVHVHGSSEELVYVLGGAGVTWQDGAAHAIGPGDAIVHRARREAHALHAGPEGLDVLIFGPRDRDESVHLPRAGVSWLAASWTDAGGPHPFRREAQAGPPEVPSPTPRPATVVAAGAVPGERRDGATVGRDRRDLGAAAGARTTRATLDAIAPGRLGAPPHCHAVEEEVLVVLTGTGTLLLGEAEHAVRAGHVVARPPGTGAAHAVRAGTAGLTLLTLGTRMDGDLVHYPRTGTVAIPGLGVSGRLTPAAPED